MVLKELVRDDSSIIEQWLRNDELGLRFVSDYKDTELILKLLSPTRRFWLAYDNEVPTGFIDLEINLPKGYFTFYIAPELRGKGLSYKLLDLLEEKAKDFSVHKLFGYSETDNTASIRALQKAGYSQSKEPDKDGLLEFGKKLA